MTSFRLTPESLRQIRLLARGGKTATQIADLLGCTRGTVESVCDRHGYELVREPAVVAADYLVAALQER